MRIALFTLSMFNGGAERVAAQLSCLWTQMGHEVVLATALPPTGKDFEHRCVAREVVDYARLDQDGMRVFCAKHKLNAVVFNDGINSDAFQTNFAAAKAICGLKVFVIIHHTANNWMYGTGNTRELFMDSVLQQADAVVCVDRIWALWWKYRGVRSVYIPNPVAIQGNGMTGSVALVRTVDEAVNALQGRKRIVWVGRLGDQLKRADLAIEIFAKYFERTIGVDGVEPTLTLLGTKTSEAEHTLRRQLRRLCPQAEKNLHILGFVADVRDVFAKSDAHFFTSVTEVTVPQVVLEAKACGVETVAFDMPFMRNAGQTIEPQQNEAKWRKLLAGESLDSDFETVDDYRNLMDELLNGQQFFVGRHLPDLLKYRRIRQRLNLGYLFSRAKTKLLRRRG